MGFTGIHETQLKIEAKHGDSRFNPGVAIDDSNYEIVEGNTIRLCEEAVRRLGEKIHTAEMNLLDISSNLIPNMPSASRQALRGPPLIPSHRQDDDILLGRFQRLRDPGSC